MARFVVNIYYRILSVCRKNCRKILNWFTMSGKEIHSLYHFPANTSTTEQRLVSSVNNGIHFHFCYVVSYYFKWHIFTPVFKFSIILQLLIIALLYFFPKGHIQIVSVAQCAIFILDVFLYKAQQKIAIYLCQRILLKGLSI